MTHLAPSASKCSVVKVDKFCIYCEPCEGVPKHMCKGRTTMQLCSQPTGSHLLATTGMVAALVSHHFHLDLQQFSHHHLIKVVQGCHDLLSPSSLLSLCTWTLTKFAESDHFKSSVWHELSIVKGLGQTNCCTSSQTGGMARQMKNTICFQHQCHTRSTSVVFVWQMPGSRKRWLVL